MPFFTITTEKSISQIWKELSKIGWKYRTSRGLSNDGRYVPPGGSLSETEGVDYFLAKPTPRKPRRAAKATLQDDDQVPQAVVPPTRAESKRKACGPNTKPKRCRSSRAIQVTTEVDPDTAVQEVPNHPASVQDGIVQGVQEIPVEAARDLELPATEAPIRAVNAGRRGVTLDDFDGDGFLAALRRDRLFEFDGEDHFNVGDGDWLLSLDSDAEGDEESNLQDENDAVDDDDFGSAVVVKVEMM
ncbi:hypothetical protein PInf_004490 [Phytophthora infestans]|nr:hypothetical protein PInf_004490 [Phytophthora infestans]